MMTTRAFALLFALLALSACAAPLQNGGVDVLPGAEARLETLCRYRAGAASSMCAPPDQPVRQ